MHMSRQRHTHAQFCEVLTVLSSLWLLFNVKQRKQRRLEPYRGTRPVQITSVWTADEATQSSPLRHFTVLYVPAHTGNIIERADDSILSFGNIHSVES